jgi:hypothetical protein
MSKNAFASKLGIKLKDLSRIQRAVFNVVEEEYYGNKLSEHYEELKQLRCEKFFDEDELQYVFKQINFLSAAEYCIIAAPAEIDADTTINCLINRLWEAVHAHNEEMVEEFLGELKRADNQATKTREVIEDYSFGHKEIACILADYVCQKNHAAAVQAAA